MNAPTPANEPARLEAVERYAVLDTPPEAAFDRITRLAAQLFEVPIALISLLDSERQWFKSCYGVDIRQAGRETAFCAHAILADDVLVVPDTTQDARFADNPFVMGEPGIRFYAGAPLQTADGFNLGTLCLLDVQPRQLTPDERLSLADLATLVVDELELRRSARQLHASEERFKSAFNRAAIGMAMVAPDGWWLQVNHRLCDILGYSEDELCQRTFQDITHPDDLEADLEHVRLLLSGGSDSYQLEKRYFHQNGSIVWVLLDVALVRDGAGEPLHFVSQIQDITQRKQDEKLFNDSQERLRLLESVAVHANDAILITEAEPIDLPGPRILYANEAFCRMSGYSLPEIIGQTPRILQGQDTSRESRDRIRAALSKWEPVVVELLNYHKNGTPFWVELSIVPVANESGWYTHWVSLQRDITHRKEFESTLMATRDEAERARAEAERANQSKNDFLSRMSHELRTPLNAILGFGQLLEMAPLTADDAQSAEQIVKAGRHLLGLINEVLDIARIESGHLPLSPEPVAIREAIMEALDLIRPLAAQRNISLDSQALQNETRWVRADRQRLKQVLLNLLSNAIKYNRDSGAVRLNVEATDAGRLRVSIADTGQGIAADKMGRLFTPFDRLDAEHSDIEGTGVGLALSLRLVTAMGGTLTVASEPGSGSIFWVELPQSTDPVDDLPGDAAPSALMSLNNGPHTILYIEDNLSNVGLIERLLGQRPGIRLLTAMQGGLGLEMAHQHQPDLILLDLNLPGMQGEEVLHRLREGKTTRDIPVIVVSADSTPRQIKRLMNAGARSYLTKPFNVHEFMKIVEDSLPMNVSRRVQQAF